MVMKCDMVPGVNGFELAAYEITRTEGEVKWRTISGRKCGRVR